MTNQRTAALNALLHELEHFECDWTAYFADPEPQGFTDRVLSGKISSLAAFCERFGWHTVAAQLREMIPLGGTAVECVEALQSFVVPEVRTLIAEHAQGSPSAPANLVVAPPVGGSEDRKALNIFISYCHRDSEWLSRVQVHLRPLARDGLLDVWDDTRLQPGAKWKEGIRAALSRADAAVLLISADFMASEFIATDELPPLLRAAEERGAKVLPVIVGHSLFAETPALSKYQAVNSPDKPLASLRAHEADETLLRLALAVRQHAEARRSPSVIAPSVAHAALQGLTVQGPLSERLLALVRRVQSRDGDLAGCVSDVLSIALETNDLQLRTLCQCELAGYGSANEQSALLGKLVSHRTIEFYISIGAEVNIDHFGSGSLAVAFMEENPREFPRMKFLFPEPIGQVQGKAASSTGDSLLRLSMPAKSLVPATALGDSKVFLYAPGRTLSKVVDGLRTTLTEVLLRKLSE